MNTIPLQKQTAFKYCTLLLMAVLMLFSSVKAQISVSGGNGLSATYTTFTTSGTGLFAALNASSQAGQVITVTVTGNVTEPATGVALTGAAGMWDLLSISPSGGAARTISGASTTDLFDFSGAQNVIIDGLNTGGNSLTITNTTAGSASTIRFINDAKSIKIRNCTIAGSANASQRAVVLFGTGVATGNDNIRISGCDIGAAGTNYPTNCVFSLGTSLAIDNSSDTLDNNTIHDFYSNTLPSFGIHLNNTNVSSSSSWFVNSNKIYQTVSRTYATANTHQLIALGTGAGHVCSNNTLGFGSSNGTGLFTVTSGTGTTRFVGISVTNSDLTGTPISVQGNTISGFSITSANTNATTSPTFAGIHITAGNANIGTVTGNTIGATTGTGSIAIITTASNGGAIGILMASTGTVNISNNNVGSISVTSATATNALGLYGIYGSAVSASLTVSNNTIGNSTASNMVAGTLGTTTGTTSVGGFIAGSVPTALTVNGNTIRNLISNSSGTSTFVRGIASGTSGTTASVNIYNNTINNLSSNGLLNNASSGQTAAQGIQLGSGLNGKIYGNTIYNIQCINTTASTSNVIASGIGLTAAQSTSVFNNKIYGITNAGTGTTLTAPPMAVGIVIRAGTTNDSIYNNMISLGSGQTTNTVFIGILGNHGSTPDPTSYIFHNTINIEGTVTSGALPSFCLHRGDFSTTARTQAYFIKNNIFTNTRTGGTGKHFVIGNNYNSTGAATNFTCDYNILNANSATIGYTAAADQTFASWKTAMGGDVNSYSGVTVTYVASATGDLHLNMGTNSNFMESYGDATVGIATDFDGQVRPGPVGSINGGAAAPDLGADEFDGVLSFTCTAPGASTVNASVNPITCYGSSTVLSLATSYSGTGFQYQWQVSSDNINFTNISGALFPTYSAIPVAVTTYYRCIVTCANGPVSTTSSSITITAPTVMTGGTYTINSLVSTGGTNYNTFTEAFNDMNCRGISGPVVFNVASGSGPYNEQVVLNQITGASATNTITINGNGRTLSFNSSASATRSGIVLNGADYVTIDNLIIDASAGTYGWGVLFTNGADYNTISNSTIKTSTTSIVSLNTVCILFSASTTALLAGTSGSYNTITNNTLIGGYYTVGMSGNSTTYQSNNTLTNNIITDYYAYGVYVVYQNNFNISGNDVSRPTRTTTTTSYGINLNTGGSGNLVKNNRVHNLFDGFPSNHTNITYGIVIASTGTLAAPNYVYNNMVYNITGNGSIFGIQPGGAYCKAYHNTIVLNDANTTSAVTNGLYITSSAVAMEVKNNLVYITRGGTGTKRCINVTVTTTNLTCDYNNYYLAAPAGTDNAIGQYSSSIFNALTDWKTANSNAYDANGRNLNPVFADVANNDFSPTSGSLDNLGTYVNVATDILNNVRSNTTPDIGAIEFTGTGCIDPPTPGTATSSVSNVCSGANFTLNVTGNTIGSGQTYQWQISSDNTNFNNIGTASSTQTYTTSQTTSNYYRVAITCSGGATVYSTSVYVTTNPLMSGNFTINKNAAASSTNFTSFASAISAMTCGINGATRFDVIAGSGPYNEQISIPQIIGASNTNIIKFNGNGNTVSFASTNSNLRVGLDFNGADHVKIDSLIIDVAVTGATFGTGVLFRNTADSNKLTRCTINAGFNTTSSNFTAVSFSSSVTSNTSGATGSYDSLIGNKIIGGYYGIYMNGPTSTYAQKNVFINNTIQDCYSYSLNLNFQSGTIISGNDIWKPNRTSLTTGYGIYLASSNPSIVIEKNKIHDLFAQAPTSVTTSYPIYVSYTASAGTETTIKNNLIYNMNSASTIYGIYVLGGYMNIYNNTIILGYNGTSTGTIYGINVASNYTNLDIKNNFIYITSASTGAKSCLNIGQLAANNNIDYNYYYVSNNYGSNNNIASVGSGPVTGYATLSDWQASGNGYDMNSISSTAAFVDAANGNYTPTTLSLNNKGTVISSVVDDILGVTRSASTPDIGCYEFDILGCTGTPSAGTVTVTTTKACSGDNFTLDVTGVSYGVGITYQWQSSTNNISWTDVGALLDNTTTFITNQTSDHYYRLKVVCSSGTPSYSASVFVYTPSLVSGTFTIDASQPTGGGNFASITEAADYISCGVNGPVIFNVVPNSGPYNEQVRLGVILGASSTNTITFNGNGNTLSFNSNITSDRAGFALIGSDYVTINNFIIDGSTSTFATGIMLTAQADNNTISNCTINMGTTLTSSNFAGISISGSTSSPTGTGIGTGVYNGSNNLITDNTIIGTYYAITLVGGTVTRATGNRVVNNQVRDCYYYNIYLTYQKDAEINDNEITRPNRTSYGAAYCIYVSSNAYNCLIQRNKIHDLFTQAPTSTTSTYGLYVASVTAATGNEVKLYNNIMYNIGGNGTVYGVYTTSSNFVQAYHNTIVLDGTDATTSNCYGIYQATTAADVYFRNNNIVVAQSGSGAKRCIYFSTTTSSIISNNNNLFMNATSGSNNYVGQFGTLNYADVASWKTANGGAYDQNSVSVNPSFASGTYIPRSTGLNGVGATTLGVNSDLLNNDRTLYFTPGAYEVDNVTPVITNSIITSSCSGSVGATSIGINGVTITDASGIVTSGVNAPRVYFRKGTSSSWISVAGTMVSGVATNSNWNFTIPYSMVGGVTTGDIMYYFIVAQDAGDYPNVANNTTGLVATSVNSINTYPTTGNSVTIITSLTPSIVISTLSDTICGGNTTTFTSVATNGGSSPIFEWRKNGINVGSGSSIDFLGGTLSTSDIISCVLTANNSCQTTATAYSNNILLTVKTSPVVLQTKSQSGATITSASICTLGIAGTTRFGNLTPYGVWSSSNPSVASVTYQGYVTGNTNGTATIRYTIASTNGCVAISNVLVSVAQQVTPNATTGGNSICIGSTTSLVNNSAIPSGGFATWSSSNNRGSISNGGVYTGANAGNGEARYTVTNAAGCSAFVNYPITINPTPAVPTIAYAPGTPLTGPTSPFYGAPSGSFCVGKSFTVIGSSNIAGSGVWSATGAASITSGGVVTINSVGVGTIKYTYTSNAGCVNSRTLSASGFTCASRGTNVEELAIGSTDFTMYPNPARSVISLQVDKLIGGGNIVVTDLYGKAIKTQPLSMGTNNINISTLSKGMYLVSVITNDGKTTKKVVVE